MHSQAKSLLRFAIIAAVLLVLAFVVVPELSTIRWTGLFTLTLDFTAEPQIDTNSIRYIDCPGATCPESAELAQMELLGDWRMPASVAGRFVDIFLMSGGEHGFFGLIDTCHHASRIVLQYETVDEDGNRVRRRSIVPVPAGRGDRAVTVDFTDVE